MENKIHIGRQVILDRSSTVIGYELLFREVGALVSEVKDDRFATAKVLTDTLNAIGLQPLVGTKTAFINIDRTFLLNRVVESIPADGFVLEILETTIVDEELTTRIKELHAKGYVFALDDFDFSAPMIKNFEPIFPYLTMVKVDLMLSPPDVEAFSAKIEFFKALGVELLAEKVETKTQYERCLKMGFSYFQGFFFAKPDIIEGKKINPNKLALVQLIKLLISQEPFDVIEAHISRSPEILVNLLRYLNSASFGIKREITSIKQAVALLGYGPLMRWLTLLFYSIRDSDSAHMQPLLETVLLRAEIMKQLTLYAQDKQTADKAYFVGLISMLDVILHRDMKDILQDMAFEPAIQEAILESKALIGKTLKLTRCIEQSVSKDELALCNELSLTYENLADALATSYGAVMQLLEELQVA